MLGIFLSAFLLIEQGIEHTLKLDQTSISVSAITINLNSGIYIRNTHIFLGLVYHVTTTIINSIMKKRLQNGPFVMEVKINSIYESGDNIFIMT